MKQLTAISMPDSPDRPWRSLHIFNIYRLIVTGIIAVIFIFTKQGDTAFGLSSPKIFALTILFWVVANLASGFASRLRWPNFNLQVSIIMLIDICCVTLLIYSSGGIKSGLGTLMLVTIAASSILLSGRITFAFAALAALSLLVMHGYAILSGLEPTAAGYTQIGLLGAGLFAVSFITHIVALRIRESETLAFQRGKELADLSKINELIIQQMDIGILVVHGDGQILLHNNAAMRILGIDRDQVLVDRVPLLEQGGAGRFRLIDAAREIGAARLHRLLAPAQVDDPFQVDLYLRGHQVAAADDRVPLGHEVPDRIHDRREIAAQVPGAHLLLHLP